MATQMKGKSAPAKPAAKSAAPSKAVATQRAPSAQAVATQDDVPDYIKKGRGRGNEEVDTGDVLIPRIELVQAISPCVDKNDASYIQGAEAGGFINSVSREYYGERITVVPVLFRKEYLVWKDRKKGGGFRGAHPSAQEARDRIMEEPENEQDDFEVQETAQQLVLLVREDGSSDEAVISMARTKMKVSKQWNSMIRMAGGDRFARSYDLFGVADENDQGKFYNIGIVPAGFPPEEIYKKAEALYESIASGIRKMAVDTGEGPEGATSGDRGSGEY